MLEYFWQVPCGSPEREKNHKSTYKQKMREVQKNGVRFFTFLIFYCSSCVTFKLQNASEWWCLLLITSDKWEKKNDSLCLDRKEVENCFFSIFRMFQQQICLILPLFLFYPFNLKTLRLRPSVNLIPSRRLITSLRLPACGILVLHVSRNLSSLHGHGEVLSTTSNWTSSSVSLTSTPVSHCDQCSNLNPNLLDLEVWQWL